MILSAELLTTLDACELKLGYSQKYIPKTISPLGILYAAIESAVISQDPEQEAKDATMRLASSRDLTLTELNKFVTIRHLGYLAAIISVALKDRLGVLKRVNTLRGDDFDWQSGLFETNSGARHRIELVSHFDDDRLRAAAHSWRVIGELAALQEPLTLTAVVIGAQRAGRRHSEWSKGLLHPMNKVLRFAPRNAKKSGFNDSWEKVWREHRSEISTEKWLEAMKQDEVLDSLIISREIPYKEDNRIVAARRDMRLATYAVEGASENSPMRRSSCDDWGGCPFAFACWSPTPVTPEDLPDLYQIREAPREEVAEYTSPCRSV